MATGVTTLYLRGMSTELVREAKAKAARRGGTLASVVSEALARSLEEDDARAGGAGAPARRRAAAVQRHGVAARARRQRRRLHRRAGGHRAAARAARRRSGRGCGRHGRRPPYAGIRRRRRAAWSAYHRPYSG